MIVEGEDRVAMLMMRSALCSLWWGIGDVAGMVSAALRGSDASEPVVEEAQCFAHARTSVTGRASHRAGR